MERLDDDIKTAALEALFPGELEQHLAMNRARLITFKQVRSEIQAYIEARRIRIHDSCDKEHLRSDGGWQERQEREQGRFLLALQSERPFQHRVSVESQESICSGGTQNKGCKGKPKNVTGFGAPKAVD